MRLKASRVHFTPHPCPLRIYHTQYKPHLCMRACVHLSFTRTPHPPPTPTHTHPSPHSQTKFFYAYIKEHGLHVSPTFLQSSAFLWLLSCSCFLVVYSCGLPPPGKARHASCAACCIPAVLAGRADGSSFNIALIVFAKKAQRNEGTAYRGRCARRQRPLPARFFQHTLWARQVVVISA